MQEVIIGDKCFKSRAECERYTRSLLVEMGVCESMKDNNKIYFNYFLLLGKRHPDYEEKFRRFKDFEIRRDVLNKKGLAIDIINSDDTITEISWITCVKGGKKSTKELFTGALRCLISDQINDYRKSADLSYCLLCKCSLLNKTVHIDHYEKQFAQLVSEFLDMNQDVEMPTNYDKIEWTYQPVFKEQDKWIGNRFEKYHLDNATYRVLCEKCNLSRKKWKQPAI